MKEFIEKLIGRLEYLQKDKYVLAPTVCYVLEGVKQYVNQLAEEYNKKHEPTMDLLEYGVEGYNRHLQEQYRKGYTDAKKEKGWISCSERLPEVSGEYYTYVYYDGHYMYSVDEIDCDGMVKKWNCVSDYKVVAWKPIEPYQTKEGKDGR